MKKEKREQKTTSFQTIYDSFLNLITDDMYLEWSEEDVRRDLKNIFLGSMSSFEFPRFGLYDFHEEGDLLNEDLEAEEDAYNVELTIEEINIFAHLMMVNWTNRQLASVDLVRQAYGTRDFEFTSQANHLSKLLEMKKEFKKEAIRLQRLYTRRKMGSDGKFVPNYEGFGGKS